MRGAEPMSNSFRPDYVNNAINELVAYLESDLSD